MKNKKNIVLCIFTYDSVVVLLVVYCNQPIIKQFFLHTFYSYGHVSGICINIRLASTREL